MRDLFVNSDEIGGEIVIERSLGKFRGLSQGL